MASSSSIRAGSAFIELFVNDSARCAGLDRASKKLKAFGEGIRGPGRTSSPASVPPSPRR